MARQVQASLVVEKANELVKEIWGKKGAELAKAISLKSGILKFRADNSIMAQELNLKKQQMISGLNNRFGQQTVKKLKIVQKAVDQNEF